MAVKKNDFVEIEYTGRLKEEKVVFDTTDEKTAKENDIHNPNALYGPVVICIGHNHVVKGLDDALVGKEPGKHTIELPAENAFGKKDAKLIQMIPMKKFSEHEIRPFPGLQINIDNVLGTVRSVSGGRVLVDFNHPLAGRDVVYDIKINKLVSDKKVQVDALMKLLLGVKDAVISVEGDIAKITLKAELPKEIADEVSKNVTELTGLKKVEFLKEEKKEGAKEKPKKETPEKEQKV